MHYTVDGFIGAVNVLGTLAFAFSGSMAAIKKEADLFGVLILSLVAASCGGLARDLVIGDLPPELMRGNLMLVLAIVAGLTTYFGQGRLSRLRYPIDFFDALGLGLFAVVGADKALAFGLSPVWSALLGLLTGVGGGVARDMMLARVPTIFTTDIYATPALLGAAALVAGKSLWPAHAHAFMALGAVLCTGLRLMALHFGWHVRK